ncbi:hypothetical protein E4U35_005962 [Claviceps purpurea]|nr:hypothetical protein E4U36_006794 [Claviceps purpurea]KAG6210118.1 hypothetical protein E4U35_005962 [Claviceps purpurea]KAG6287726.1 hypothetical protein E4U46_003888 [Claviceps purpurea]
MKFSGVLSSLAICAFQVAYATPLEANSVAESADSSDRLGARDDGCCVLFQNQNNLAHYVVPKANDVTTYPFVGYCQIHINRKAGSCNGWTFTADPDCNDLAQPLTLEVRPRGDCY